MNRRAATRTVLVLAIVALAITIGRLAAPAPTVLASTVPEPPPPPVTINDFIPEEQNLSDCLGALERPGCGSESRGGWRQTAVFVVMAAGVGLVFWRVSVGVRRNRDHGSSADA